MLFSVEYPHGDFASCLVTASDSSSYDRSVHRYFRCEWRFIPVELAADYQGDADCHVRVLFTRGSLLVADRAAYRSIAVRSRRLTRLAKRETGKG